MSGQGYVAHVSFQISPSCEMGREVARSGKGCTEGGDKGCIYILFHIQIPAFFPIFSSASVEDMEVERGHRKGGDADCMLNESKGVKH